MEPPPWSSCVQFPHRAPRERAASVLQLVSLARRILAEYKRAYPIRRRLGPHLPFGFSARTRLATTFRLPRQWLSDSRSPSQSALSRTRPPRSQSPPQLLHRKLLTFRVP